MKKKEEFVKNIGEFINSLNKTEAIETIEEVMIFLNNKKGEQKDKEKSCDTCVNLNRRNLELYPCNECMNLHWKCKFSFYEKIKENNKNEEMEELTKRDVVIVNMLRRISFQSHILKMGSTADVESSNLIMKMKKIAELSTNWLINKNY